MDITSILAILILIFLFALALTLIYRDRNSPKTQIFAALIFFINFWVASNLLAELAPSLTGIIFWNQIKLVFAAVIPSLGVYFSYLFPVQEKLNRLKKIILIVLPFSFLILAATKWNLASVAIDDFNEIKISYGPAYFLLFLNFVFLVGWAFFRLVKSYLKNKRARLQIRYIFLGSFFAILTALFGLVGLPYFFGVDPPAIISVIAILFFAIFASYAMLHHYLGQSQVMTAEIFTGLLALILLANVFSSRTWDHLAFNIGLFLATVVFGVFLVKSVVQEAQSREKIEFLANKIEKANKKLRQLDEAKSEFVSIASHQLRTPLSAIKGYTSLILDGTFGKLDQAKKEALGRIYASNERLISLVNDLLDLSRIERGKLEFSFETLDLSLILGSVVKEFKLAAKSKGLKLEYHPQKLPLVKADANKIRQVFINIIDNGIKYTDEGWVKIKTQKTKRKVLIAFANSGRPLSGEEISLLYEKFSRGETGALLHPGGVGIGLYIALKIVRAHKGRIWAKNAQGGKGCAFYVELPRLRQG